MRYKRIYIGAFIVVLFTGVAFLLLNRRYTWFDEKDVTLIIGIVALLVSIVSLAIADPKLRKFKGRLEIWNTGTKDKDGYYLCAIRLINRGKDPLVNLNVHFRYPDSLYSRPGLVTGDYDYFKLEGWLIVNNDKYRFLGFDLENNYADFEHSLRLENWKQNATISIHADGMDVKTFVLKPELAPRLETEIGKSVIFDA